MAGGMAILAPFPSWWIREKRKREKSIPVDRLVPIHIRDVGVKMLPAHMNGGRDPADGGWRSSRKEVRLDGRDPAAETRLEGGSLRVRRTGVTIYNKSVVSRPDIQQTLGSNRRASRGSIFSRMADWP